ncbi:hypothetical protein AAG906_003631 [Vitis piasezkii]
MLQALSAYDIDSWLNVNRHTFDARGCRKYVSPFEAFYAIGNASRMRRAIWMLHAIMIPISRSKRSAKSAEVTIIFVGTDLSIEAKFVDRVDFLLPCNQTELIKQVAEVSNGPVILVVLSGSNIDITFAKNNPNLSHPPGWFSGSKADAPLQMLFWEV